MKIGYVVLYVHDAQDCLRFWTEKMGMVEKSRQLAGEFAIVQVGFPDQDVAFELVPLALMQNNPDNLDLATPSIAMRVPDLVAARAALISNGVQATEIGMHPGVESFAFQDNENRWFAVLQG